MRIPAHFETDFAFSKLIIQLGRRGNSNAWRRLRSGAANVFHMVGSGAVFARGSGVVDARLHREPALWCTRRLQLQSTGFFFGENANQPRAARGEGSSVRRSVGQLF